MNRTQKTTWFLIITILSAVVVSGVAVALLAVKIGMPKALAGGYFLGIAGLGGLAPLIFRKDKGKVRCDERDKLINRRAALAGFGSSYLLVGLVCMIPFFVLGPEANISVVWLPMIFVIACIGCFFGHSVAVLIQYGRGSKDGKE